MFRLLGFLGFTSGFFLISPALRDTVTDLAGRASLVVQSYSPFSYVVIVLLLFGGVTLTLATGSSPR
ncbi:MAG TPA: hypothetical protein VJ732_01995 [Bryobacteraceae bacterium]|nr:hypothetical protein [Bryobacteraceae bacterium]